MDRCLLRGVRDRADETGIGGLSDRDVLALALGCTTSADRALALAGGTLTGLRGRRAGEYTEAGLSAAQADRLLACAEIGRRMTLPAPDAPLAGGSADVAARCADVAGDPEEVFVALKLDARNRIRGRWIVARGWESGVNLTPRQVFTLLLKENASRVVFVHNHPSGDPTASPEDVRFTRQLIEGARTLGIKVLDHVIVAPSRHCSMRTDRGGELEFGG